MPRPRRTGLTVDRLRPLLTTPVGAGGGRRGDAGEAAVLVPLFEEGGEARVVLTRRAATLRSHRGEVSFPGGRADPGEDLVAAALREAAEEVSLDAGIVEVIGALGQLQTISSRALITPYVGIVAQRPVLEPNPHEVDRVFDVSLADLLADGVHRTEIWGLGTTEIEVQFFDLPADIVWGATARILVDLLGRVTGTRVGGWPLLG